ncbi:unnamed protein product [Closterium sp. Yama58-4]|nr:unnamed protein product [Closterium sp. Yama58-4]
MSPAGQAEQESEAAAVGGQATADAEPGERPQVEEPGDEQALTGEPQGAEGQISRQASQGTQRQMSRVARQPPPEAAPELERVEGPRQAKAPQQQHQQPLQQAAETPGREEKDTAPGQGQEEEALRAQEPESTTVEHDARPGDPAADIAATGATGADKAGAAGPANATPKGRSEYGSGDPPPIATGIMGRQRRSAGSCGERARPWTGEWFPTGGEAGFKR